MDLHYKRAGTLFSQKKYFYYLYKQCKKWLATTGQYYLQYVNYERRTIVCGSGSRSVFEFNKKDGTFSAIPYKKAYPGANFRKSIQEDQNGLFYIVAENSAVHIYDPRTSETKMITTGNGTLNVLSIKTKVLFVSPHEVWIGTDGGGINIYDPTSGEMQYLIPDSRNSTSLNSKAVFKLYQDKDQNIWVGHYNMGISVWKRNKEKFISYHFNPFDPQTINKEVVSAIFEDSKGRIWLGQDGGGLDLFHPETQTFEHFRHENGNPQSLTTDVILTIHEDPDGNLLLGTYSGGLMIFDPDRKKVIKAFGRAGRTAMPEYLDYI